MSDDSKITFNFGSFLLEKLGANPMCVLADSVKIKPVTSNLIEIEWEGYASLSAREFYRLVHEHRERLADSEEL